MSTTTTNYSLIKTELTDVADITVLNQNWDVIDTELFNRVKLDENGKIPSEHLPSAESFEVTVPITGWVTSDTMYTVTLSVNGITSDFDPIYGLKPAGNYSTEEEDDTFSLIKGLVTGTNTVTLYASEVPTTSVTLTLKGV